MTTSTSNMSPAEKRALLARLLQEKVRTSRSYRLSFAQERLWFLDQFQPSPGLYNLPLSISLHGPLDVPALQRALDELVRRHEGLRTTFPTEHGAPVQRIAPARPVPLPVLDLRAREADLARILAEEAAFPFDLAKGPLFRALLVRVSDADHVLSLSMHHIVSDGWSTGVLLRELGVLHAAFARGEPSPLPELPLQYVEFAQQQREALSGATLNGLVSHWRARLAGAPRIVDLPTDRPRPAAQSFRGAWQTFYVERSVSDALLALSRREGATLFMTLLAAFKALLHRYTAQDDLVVGTPIANRNRVDIEGIVGFFVNTLVLRTDLSGDPTFRALLGRIREVTLEAYAHQDLPFEKLVMELQPDRNLSHNPLFQVFFALQNTPISPRQASPRRETEGPRPPAAPVSGTSKFDLTLNVTETTEGLMATFEYSTDLFDHATITRMIGHLQTLLTAVAEEPDRRLSALPLLTPAERHKLLIEWNDTETEFRQDACPHQLFEEQADRAPGAVAVAIDDRVLTYRDLDRRGNQLARRLRRLGVGRGVRVGVCMERSLDLIVAIMAIFKAGGAFVPLDPDHPQARLAYVLRDSGAPVVLTQGHLVGRLETEGVELVSIDSDWRLIAEEDDARLDAVTTPDDLLAVYYTSGSTGRPKGSLMAARGYLNVCDWKARECAIPGQRVFLMTPYAFDASFKTIMTPLLTGGALALAGPDSHDIGAILDALEKLRPTTTFSVPSLLYALIELARKDGYRSLSSLRSIRFGGEPTDVKRLRPWAESPDFHCALLHDYGPVECSDAVTEYIPARGEFSTASSFPIGKPIQNVNAFVVDRNFNLQPIGVPGELCLSGVCLSKGYLNRPELTAEKFVDNPFRPGQKMYRTGDRVRWLASGDLEFLGRIDRQVKIRGIRIELPEIEVTLGQHPAVRSATIVVREDKPGDRRLVGYVVARPDHTISTGELRRFLRARLPDYMVPPVFVALESLPLSPNGKVDHSALPAPDAAPGERDAAFAAARSPVEEMVAGIWGEVLGIDRVGIHDDFFELGGHSLSATQIVSRIRDAVHWRVPLRLIFEARTVADFSAALVQDPNHGPEVQRIAGMLAQVAALARLQARAGDAKG